MIYVADLHRDASVKDAVIDDVDGALLRVTQR